jgi:VWFA-related protein
MKKYSLSDINYSPAIMLIIAISLLGLFLTSNPANAGPFIKINNIDAKTEFPIVKIFITARNVDQVDLSGLNEENIYIYEDGFRVNYVRVLSYEESKDLLYLVFSIDSSKSISKEYFKKIKKTAKEIIINANPNDRIAIYRFNNEVLMLNSFTNNRAKLIESINKIERHGDKTLLFDAIYDSIDILSKAEVSRKAIIVFTDGKDEGSSISIKDIVKFSRDLDIPIHFICMKSSKNKTKLARISKLTGGKLIYSTDANDFAGMYKAIIKMIKSQYVVQYKTMLKPDGKKHQIEARLKYATIRDRDLKEITPAKRIFDIKLPSLSEIILITLFIILIALVIVILYYFLKRNKIAERMYHPAKEFSGAYREYRDSIDRSEKLRYERDYVITPQDPEYVYSKAWLVEKDGPEAGRKFPIFWDEVTIGRDEVNTIVVKDDAVSLKHAKIKKFKNAYYLFDLISDNGTFLNRKKLLRPKPLYDWDEIGIGRTMFIFRGSKLN